MKLIQTITNNTTAGMNLINIPQTFTDLLVVGSLRASFAAGEVNTAIFPNGFPFPLTVTNREIFGNGSVQNTSTNATNQWINGGRFGGTTTTANTFNNFSVYIPNYSRATQQKLMSVDSVFENNDSFAMQIISSTLWPQTQAITSLLFDISGVATSTISLYGITRGSSAGITTSP